MEKSTLFVQLTLIIVKVFAFQQSDYRIVHERVSIDFYNKSHVRDLKFFLFHYTRTQKRFKGSMYVLNDVIGHDLTNTAQAYKFSSNEYREFPVYYSGNVCDMDKLNTFGTSYGSMDTNLTICPTRKGYYYIANAYLDDSKLPPNAPRGRYMLEVKAFYNKSILLGAGKWHFAIEPTNPLEKVI